MKMLLKIVCCLLQVGCSSLPDDQRALIEPEFRAAGHFSRNDARLRCLAELLRTADVERSLDVVVYPLAGPEELQSATAGMLVGALAKANPSSGPIRIQTAEEDTARYITSAPLYQPQEASRFGLKGQIEIQRGVLLKDLDVGFGFSSRVFVDAGWGFRDQFDVMILRLYPVVLRTRDVLSRFYVEVAAAYPALQDQSLTASIANDILAGTLGLGKAQAAPDGRVAEQLVGLAVFEIIARYFDLPTGCSEPVQLATLEEGNVFSAVATRIRGAEDALERERKSVGIGQVRSPDASPVSDTSAELAVPPAQRATKIGIIASARGVVLVPNGDGYLHCYGLGAEERVQRLRLSGLSAEDRVLGSQTVAVQFPSWRVSAVACFLTERSVYAELTGLEVRSYQEGFVPLEELKRVYVDIDPRVVHVMVKLS